MEKRAIRPEDAAVVCLVSLGIYQVIGFVLGAVFKTHNNVYIFLAYAIPQIVYVGVTVGHFLLMKVSFRPLPTRHNVKTIHYLFAAITAHGLFFFALLPVTGVQLLFAHFGKELTVTVPDLTKPISCVVAVFVMCLLPAVGEELVYRKVLCDAFASYGKVAAILLSGVVFGLSHLSLAQTVHQIFLGWVLAFIYVKTKNVTLTSLIHFINNFLALFLPRFTGEEIWNNYTVLGICCAVGAVLLAGGAAYFALRTPRIFGRKRVLPFSSEITAVYVDGERVELDDREEEPERKKPSALVIGFFVIITVLWILSAVFI